VLVHELVHVLQYRREGFKDFTCKYSLECGGGGVFDLSCAFGAFVPNGADAPGVRARRAGAGNVVIGGVLNRADWDPA
jgi:hypothetical protein